LIFSSPEAFDFGVAFAFADQGSPSNHWVGTGPTSHVFDPAARDHD
jgi:hypothetical protein